MVTSVAAFLESDGFPRTLVAGLEVPTPLYAFGVAVLVRCEKKQELRQLVQLLFSLLLQLHMFSHLCLHLQKFSHLCLHLQMLSHLL